VQGHDLDGFVQQAYNKRDAKKLGHARQKASVRPMRMFLAI